MHHHIRWLLISGGAPYASQCSLRHVLYAIRDAIFLYNMVQPVIVGKYFMVFYYVMHVTLEDVIAVVNMKNFLVLLVIYSRYSCRGCFCFRLVKSQNHLSPAQKEKKKKRIDAAWVHSMRFVCCVDQRCLIPVQGSQE